MKCNSGRLGCERVQIKFKCFDILLCQATAAYLDPLVNADIQMRDRVFPKPCKTPIAPAILLTRFRLLTLISFQVSSKLKQILSHFIGAVDNDVLVKSVALPHLGQIQRRTEWKH